MKALLKFFLVILLIIPFSLSGANDYQAHAKEVRETVWNWDKPEFKTYEVPEKYKNESAVILAHHNEFIVTNKSKFKLGNMLFTNGPNVVNRLYYTEIDRYMVQINDKKALEEYSELSYREEYKFSSRPFSYVSNKTNTIIGARVIKPDGKIKEIDIKEEAVSVTEGKKDKEAYKKIAMSDLQEGDILDYFYCTEMELEDTNIPPVSFCFFDQHPVISYSVSCEFGKNLTVEYRSINGAPDMTEKQDDDGNIILEAQGQSLPKIEPVRWMSPLRDLPMIRMAVLNNANNIIYKPANARKKGVYKNVSPTDILDDAKCVFAGSTRYLTPYRDVTKTVKKDVQNYQQKTSDVNNEELASYIYDALHFRFINYFGFNNLSPDIFFMLLQDLLKTHNIEYQIGFVTSKYDARADEILSFSDLNYIITANNGKNIFCFPYAYTDYSYLDPDYQGELAHTITISKFVSNKAEGISGTPGEYFIPEANSKQNAATVTSEVSFSEKDPLLLNINRRTTWAGDLKKDIQKYWVLYYDWDVAMRERLLIEKTFLQGMEENRNGKKNVEDFKKQLEERRNKLKDKIKDEVKEYYDRQPVEFLDYKIENIGVASDNPELICYTTYTMDGFVKKAGDNLILNAGKLVGQQWKPIDADRDRIVNAYIPTARSFENEVQIIIPDGFVVEEPEKLNSKVETEYGLFESVSQIENNKKLIIKVRKEYKKPFVPVKDWSLLLGVLDKASEFGEVSVVLKKQNKAVD